MVGNVLIKASGDVIDKKEVLNFAKKKARKNYVVLICGAGTKIGSALEKHGYKIKFNEHGRITKTIEEREIARGILEGEQRRLEDKLIGTGVCVEIPIIKLGSVLCPINGDSYVKAGYLGFDEIYVFTLRDRVVNKKKIFYDFPKVEVVGV